MDLSKYEKTYKQEVIILEGMNRIKGNENRSKENKCLREQIDELLHRYFKLPLLIRQSEEVINGGPELKPPLSLTVNHANNEFLSHPHRLKEQQYYDQVVAEAEKELNTFMSELAKMNTIRNLLSEDEETVWDYKYKRRRRKDIHVRDELGWGNNRYYNALNGLRKEIADIYRL